MSDFEGSRKNDIIKTFRTMTTMMNVIQGSHIRSIMQRSTVADPDSDSKISQANRHKLRMLAALATLLVRDHEVAAAVSKDANVGPGGKLNMDVVTCVSKDSPGEVINAVPDRGSEGNFSSKMVSKGDEVVTIANPRRPDDGVVTPNGNDALTFTGNSPTVLESQDMSIDISNPMEYVLRTWSVLPKLYQ